MTNREVLCWRATVRAAWPLLEWREQIESLPFLRPEGAVVALVDYRKWRLRRAALDFLDGPFARQAIDAGWDATHLFGVNPEEPTTRPQSCDYGLVVYLAWYCMSLTSIDATGAMTRSRFGEDIMWTAKVLQFFVPFWKVSEAAWRTDVNARRLSSWPT